MFLLIDLECTPFFCGLEVNAQGGYASEWFADFDETLLNGWAAICADEDAARDAQVTVEPCL